MKPIFSTILLITLFSCSGGKSRQENENHVQNQIKHPDNNDLPDDEEPEVEPVSISSADLKHDNLQLPDPLNSDSLLVGLFPGRYVKPDEDSGAPFVLWSCEACEKTPFRTWMDGEDTYFPLDEATETELLHTYFYTEKGKEKAACFFSSHEMRMGEPGTGRFICGILGAALFEKSAGGWKLMAFDPAVDCTGNYSEAIAPDTVRVGGEQMFILYDGNGGAEGPYVGRYSLYHFSGKEFIKDVQIDGVSLQNWRFDWNSTFNFVPSAYGKPRLTVITTGAFDKDLMAELEPAHQLPDVYDNILNQDLFNSFILTRVYVFRNNKYQLETEKTDLYVK